MILEKVRTDFREIKIYTNISYHIIYIKVIKIMYGDIVIIWETSHQTKNVNNIMGSDYVSICLFQNLFFLSHISHFFLQIYKIYNTFTFFPLIFKIILIMLSISCHHFNLLHVISKLSLLCHTLCHITIDMV